MCIRDRLKFPVDMTEGDNILGIDVSNLAAGVYFVSISQESGKNISKQFVKTTE